MKARNSNAKNVNKSGGPSDGDNRTSAQKTTSISDLLSSLKCLQPGE